MQGAKCSITKTKMLVKVGKDEISNLIRVYIESLQERFSSVYEQRIDARGCSTEDLVLTNAVEFTSMGVAIFCPKLAECRPAMFKNALALS